MIYTFQIKGKTVEFIPETHKYIVEGIAVPSVSDILKGFFPNEYRAVPQATLEQASIKGTEMHEAIERYENTGEESNLTEFSGYKFLKLKLGFENIANEIPVFYERNGLPIYAGRIDQIIRLDGELYINDFKRVCSPNKDKIALQLNLYKLAYEQCYGEKINGLSFMQLRNEIRKFNYLKINEKETLKILDLFY